MTIRFLPVSKPSGLFTYHYAVWKFSQAYFMQPACKPPDYRWDDYGPDEIQGMTIVRGSVNCADCRRMMGMV